LTSTGSTNEEAPPTVTTYLIDPILNRRKCCPMTTPLHVPEVTSPGRGTCSWSSNPGT
jgi:hypothetical protein